MRHMLFLSVLLLGATWAMAQNQSQTAPEQTSPSQEQAAPASSGGNTSVQGCLSSSGGNYMLTDKNGTIYQLSGDTAKLSEHVGHEMKVTGSLGSSTTAPGSGQAAGTTGSSSQKTLEVSSFKHIAKTCQSGGGMSH